MNLLNAMFGCSHKRTTFPLTPSRRTQMKAGASRPGTYVVCLDCGKEFSYSWPEMHMGDPIGPAPTQAGGHLLTMSEISH